VKKFDVSAKYNKEVPKVMLLQPCCSPDDIMLPDPSKRTPEHLIGAFPDNYCSVPMNSPWDVSWYGQQKLDYSIMNPTREPTPEEQLLAGGVSPRKEQSNPCRLKLSNPYYPQSELLSPKASDIRENTDVLGLINEFTKIKISENNFGESKAPSLAMFGKRSQPLAMSPDILQPLAMSPDILHPLAMSPIIPPSQRAQNPGEPQTYCEAQKFIEAQIFRKNQNLRKSENISEAQTHNQYTPAPQQQPTHYNDFYYWKVAYFN
jgi:hypothetical protein